ncbi:MAG TPA: hypothetical protein VH186_19250 [Chloroflexia bacterium]|nr:hypothetical protein [Chloroflexia bacterium]
MRRAAFYLAIGGGVFGLVWGILTFFLAQWVYEDTRQLMEIAEAEFSLLVAGLSIAGLGLSFLIQRLAFFTGLAFIALTTGGFIGMFALGVPLDWTLVCWIVPGGLFLAAAVSAINGRNEHPALPSTTRFYIPSTGYWRSSNIKNEETGPLQEQNPGSKKDK